MNIELGINGYFQFTVCILNTEIPVENEVSAGVLDNLQQGEYTIGMRHRTISDINELDFPLYSFVIEPTLNTEYEFNVI